MKHSARRLSSLFLASVITASLVVAALAPLFTTPSVAQTNPQTTDIFTGQFIPAYFGAAYDPTEAFRQMAGMPVYVFAYDTWGKIVNNFAYKTQIKADGSFQAAGLPNASHYGVCLAVKDSDYLTYFRAPKPEDGIQSAFAYSQAILPDDIGTINTQIADKPADMTKMSDPNKTPATADDDQGCRVFLTSSRQVDIANHVNIFPIIPTQILSVIIKDQTAGTTDFYNSNKPYEIYAQRVVINNSERAQLEGYFNNNQPCDEACLASMSSMNSVAVGPVIRGRSIAYGPDTDGNGTPDGNATIFQAFAPRGTYAITYWRPDSRSSNANMTYLTYDGTSSLDTPYNGVAVERVAYSTPGDWERLSTRDASEDSSEVWTARYGTINAWGLATRGKQGQVVPQSNVGLSVSDSMVGFVDITSRDCVDDSSVQEHQSTIDGFYIVSSACGLNENGQMAQNNSPVKTGSINTTLSAMPAAGTGLSGGGAAAAAALSEIAVIDLIVNGTDGPSRRDISLSAIPDSLRGMLQRDGNAFRFAKIDLVVNGKTLRNIAKSDSTGFFYIPTSYFNDNPYTDYKIVVSPPYNSTKFTNNYQHIFALDGAKVLAAKKAKGGDLGTIAINPRQPGQVESFLANMSLDNLFKLIRFPTAYAQQKLDPKPDDKDIGKLEVGLNEPWKFEIDLEALGSTRWYFTPANYKLKTIEINPPDGVDDYPFTKEYEIFNRLDASEDTYQGAWLEGDSDDKTSLLIKGVQLQYNDKLALGDLFRDLGSDYLSFNLRVRFEYSAEATPRQVDEINGQKFADADVDIVEGQQGSVGQVNGLPKVLETTWPVEIKALTSDGDIESSDITGYEARYRPIVLDVASPDCSDDNIIKNGTTAFVKGIVCKLVIGGISGVKKAIGFLADHFLTVDPLNHFGSDTVIKYWNATRNLVNSLAVLILLVSGVAIMLQYEPTSYNLQSVLKKLIIAIVLVNFSILIIQIAVDIANVLSRGGYYMFNGIFEAGASGLAHANAAVGALAASLTFMLIAALASGFTGLIGAAIFFGAIIILILYVAFKIMIQYYLRLVVLWICIILAPAAFAARVLPGTATYFSRWKNALMGALVAQAALALMLSLTLAVIAEIQLSSSGIEGFVLVIAAFALLYMATKLPNRAAAMVGSDLAGGLGDSIKSGALKTQGLLGKGRLLRERRAAEKEARKVDGMDGFNKFKPINELRRISTGVDSEDLDKERASVISEAQRHRRRELEKERPGIVKQEIVSGLEDEVEKIELRSITARTGFSQSKFENYRNMADSGHNIDLSAGGKVDIGGGDWVDAYENSDFYKRMGKDEAGTISKRYLDAVTSARTAGRDVNREDELLAVLEAEFAAEGGIAGALKTKDLTFSELQGPHGARGLMLGVAADTATKVKPELNTDYNAIRNQLGRNTYDPRKFGPAAPPAPPVAAPPVVPYSPDATAWAVRTGSPPLTTPPAGGLRSGDPVALATDLARIAALAHAAGTGTVLSPAEQSEYSRLYQRLAEAGYRP